MAIKYSNTALTGLYFGGKTSIAQISYLGKIYKLVDTITVSSSSAKTSILCNYMKDEEDGGYIGGYGYVFYGQVQSGGSGNPKIYTFPVKGKFTGTLTVSATVYSGQEFGIEPGLMITKNNSQQLVYESNWIGQQTKSYSLSLDVNAGDYINVYNLFATSFWGDNASWANFSLNGTLTPT